jgi:Mg2+-importing ATPase
LALAVGLTPELLPMIITLTLTKGSLAMAKRGVIVKKLAAIENFGSMDILCTDKTGTLTEDRIEVIKYVDGFGEESNGVLLNAYLGSSFESGFKSPLDDAIKEYRHLSIAEYSKLSEIPFDFERRRSSVAVKHETGTLLITRGAPEEVLKICTKYEHDGTIDEISEEAREKILEQFKTLSQDGYRVLGVATRKIDRDTPHEISDENEMTLLGFVAFVDPAKKTVAETLRQMHDNNIEIKILTGDNDLVTQKIASDIHLHVKGILTGTEIEVMSDEKLSGLLDQTTIFARVNPEQKLRIIQLLQKAGHVVGYMGDGINDAPSLRAADTSISVNNAVDIAKDTADFILMHKSLKDLIEGIIEGRRTFANTLKYLKMALSSNFGNMFSMAGASILLPFLPMLAPQILLNNLLYDTSQLTIPLDSVDPQELQHPHVLSMSALKKFMWVFGPLSSLFDFITFFVLYGVLHLTVGQFQAGWFVESIATQVLVIWVLRTTSVPLIQSRPNRYVALTTLAAIAAACAVVFSGLAYYFKFSALPYAATISIASIVLVYLVAVQLCKSMFYRWIRL